MVSPTHTIRNRGGLDGAPRGFAKASLIKRPGEANAKDCTRQSTANRIRSLRLKIDENLRHIAGLVQRGRLDQAASVCLIVAQHRGDLLGLVERYNAEMKAEPIPEVIHHRKASSRQAPEKIKRYKMFSER